MITSLVDGSLYSRSRETVATSKLSGLDGVRGISVIMVVIAHLRSEIPRESILAPIAAIGTFGVQIFFVLSGFLITHLLCQEEKRHGAVSLKLFYYRRMLRIFPPAYFYIFFIILAYYAGQISIQMIDIVSSLLFFRNYVSGTIYTTHLWSLAIEEHFYLIWPALFVLLGNLQRFSLE